MTGTVANRLMEIPVRSDALPAMTDEQFRDWAALLEQRTGMTLPLQRKSFLVTGVGLRMRELGFEGYDAYFDYLGAGAPGRLEWTALVDRLTVQETRFFRDPNALARVEELFLPQAAEQVAAGGSVQVWSAGCATGEEAYTLAMLVHGFLAERGLPPYYGVTGSDISLPALAVARQGRYVKRRLDSLPDECARDYTVEADARYFDIVDPLRRRVCFTQMNLLDAVVAIRPGMDLVYCQNVLIYFDKDRRRRILDHLVAHMRPGGLLILGAGEALGWNRSDVEQIGASNVSAFRRRDSQGQAQQS